MAPPIWRVCGPMSIEADTMMQSTNPILIFGEALVDVFEQEAVVGGAPFNVARHLAAFGLRPVMLTRIGDDAHGALIAAEFARFGMTPEGLQIDRERATGRVTVSMNEHGHSFDIPHGQAFDRIDPAQACACLSRIGAPRYVYFGSLIQRAEMSRAALASVLRHSVAPRYLDLNLRPAAGPVPDYRQLLDGVQILKLNEDELQTMLTWYRGKPCEMPAPSVGIQDAGIAALMRTFGIALMVVTLGEAGAAAFEANGVCLVREAGIAAETLVDTVGAGDAFSSVMLAGQVWGWPLAVSLPRANRFAASICGIRGAVPRDLDFYRTATGLWSELE